MTDVLIDNITVFSECLYNDFAVPYEVSDVVDSNHMTVNGATEMIVLGKRTMAMACKASLAFEKPAANYYPCQSFVLRAGKNRIVKPYRISTDNRYGREGMTVVLGEAIHDNFLTAEDCFCLEWVYMAVTYIAGDVKVTQAAAVALVVDKDASTTDRAGVC